MGSIGACEDCNVDGFLLDPQTKYLCGVGKWTANTNTPAARTEHEGRRHDHRVFANKICYPQAL